MKDRQFHIYLDDEEYGQVLQALIDLMGGHCQYQRRCAGDWSCAFGAVFCGWYGTHLRQLQRC